MITKISSNGKKDICARTDNFGTFDGVSLLHEESFIHVLCLHFNSVYAQIIKYLDIRKIQLRNFKVQNPLK